MGRITKIRDIFYFLHRLVKPVVNIRFFITCVRNSYFYIFFIREFLEYRKDSQEKCSIFDLSPCLNDRRETSQTGGGYYFYQDLWALDKVYLSRPEGHYDVGSRIDGFVAQCSVFSKVTFIDLRAVDYGLRNFRSIKGNILELPFKDNQILSLSCLNVAEHVGLGRYGDTMEPQGTYLAIQELQRVMAFGGNLYFSVPIGRERVEFNAHRVFDPETIVKWFDQMRLVDFAAVDDKGRFSNKARLLDFEGARFSLGLFHFSEKK